VDVIQLVVMDVVVIQHVNRIIHLVIVILEDVIIVVVIQHVNLRHCVIAMEENVLIVTSIIIVIIMVVLITLVGVRQ
jgi:hypothetical protein